MLRAVAMYGRGVAVASCERASAPGGRSLVGLTAVYFKVSLRHMSHRTGHRTIITWVGGSGFWILQVLSVKRLAGFRPSGNGPPLLRQRVTTGTFSRVSVTSVMRLCKNACHCSTLSFAAELFGRPLFAASRTFKASCRRWSRDLDSRGHRLTSRERDECAIHEAGHCMALLTMETQDPDGIFLQAVEVRHRMRNDGVMGTTTSSRNADMTREGAYMRLVNCMCGDASRPPAAHVSAYGRLPYGY